jgi:hypothetical protein
MNRRQFILSSVILVAGCNDTNRTESSLMIVDTHQYLWDLR